MIAVKKVKGIEGSLLLRKVYCSYLCYRRQSMRQTKATHGALTLIYKGAGRYAPGTFRAPIPQRHTATINTT